MGHLFNRVSYSFNLEVKFIFVRKKASLLELKNKIIGKNNEGEIKQVKTDIKR